MSESLPTTGTQNERLNLLSDTDSDVAVFPAEPPEMQLEQGVDNEQVISQEVLERTADLAAIVTQERNGTLEDGKSLFRELLERIMSLPSKKAAAL